MWRSWNVYLFFCLSLATADRFQDIETRLKYLEADHGETKELLGKTQDEKDDLAARVARLEELAKVTVLRSCAEYSQFGVSTSGLYTVDPDGPFGKPPFKVSCFNCNSTFKT